MAMQRTTEGKGGQHSYTREAAEPFAIRALQQDFQRQPPKAQNETLDRVLRLLRAELGRQQTQPSALFRLASRVYGITAKDLR